METTNSTEPQSVFDYIFGLTIPGVKLELSRVREFMQIVGSPHSKYPIIHIAGTNGKGSTAAMMATILSASGLKTGLFTSPHLVIPNERVKVDGEMISDAFIIEHVEQWKPHIDRLGITFFEVLTALGFAYFCSETVDIAVIETGLGGRLDATNVVDPLASVITAVSMDHENILGNTLEQIAGEKAGIVKPGKPVFLGRNPKAVQGVVQERGLSEGSKYIYIPEAIQIRGVDVSKTSQLVDIEVQGQAYRINLPLLGRHQVENLSNVLVTLKGLDFSFDSKLIQKALDGMQWWGRIQPLQDEPPVFYDVAHNLEGLERLLEALKEAGYGDAILIPAFNARKSIQPMLDVLQDWQGTILYSSFTGHSAVNSEMLKKHGVPEHMIFKNPEVAYEEARGMRTSENQAVCFFGSHYLAESLYELFNLRS